MLKVIASLYLLGVIVTAQQTDPQNVFKICIPHHIYNACLELMNKPADNVKLECIVGRDRMDCLEKVNRREADFLAVDPEDMYVAYHMSNQDFSVFTEFRTLEESQAEFRYEGIILVRKNSDIHSLHDLKGHKSCHTGFGRNVGYKIPITKLKKHSVLKFSSDPELSPTEKELKALSEFFSKACLVGKYSPNDEINRLFKKRYSNLCELCEDPAKCDYPDKYSGYDGAIRCLVENNGDVAFTKVIFVRKYFGLPIGSNPPVGEAKANPDDYEYLCEDGSRRPIIGKACSWAQRPWQAYMGNADIETRYQRLQKRLQKFYSDAKQSTNKDLAAKLWVKDSLTLADKNEVVLPGEHLVRAQYKEVIERDGLFENKILLCVSSEVALRKCKVLAKVAYSRDIRPQFECMLKAEGSCAKAVHDAQAEVAVLGPKDYQQIKDYSLKAILYEKYDDDDLLVAVADKDLSNDVLIKSPISFNTSSEREITSALLFSDKTGKKICPNKLESTPDAPIQIVHVKDLPKFENKVLVCKDLTTKPISEFKTCNMDYTISPGVYVRGDTSGYLLDNYIHAFISLSSKFGHNQPLEDVFELFGEFESGAKNVIFSDRAIKLDTPENTISNIDEHHYRQIHCY
uniref:Transferrin n=1 Tax=Corethrella appendiculata TaxID=1370023 RepID=U5EVY8_9DIPT